MSSKGVTEGCQNKNEQDTEGSHGHPHMMDQPEPSLSLREAQLSVRLEKGSDTGDRGRGYKLSDFFPTQ